MSGGVSVLLMMSRQRESELALAGIVGATKRQQVLVPVLEGVIITVTATILGASPSQPPSSGSGDDRERPAGVRLSA